MIDGRQLVYLSPFLTVCQFDTMAWTQIGTARGEATLLWRSLWEWNKKRSFLTRRAVRQAQLKDIEEWSLGLAADIAKFKLEGKKYHLLLERLVSRTMKTLQFWSLFLVPWSLVLDYGWDSSETRKRPPRISKGSWKISENISQHPWFISCFNKYLFVTWQIGKQIPAVIINFSFNQYWHGRWFYVQYKCWWKSLRWLRV